MRKRLSVRGAMVLWLLLGLVWLGAASAQQGPYQRGLLFEVRAGAADSCWLFGTIHSEDPRVMDLPAEVRGALEGSAVMALEVVPDAQAILRSMVTMVYTDGRTLEEVVGPAAYRDVVDAMQERGLAEAAIRDFKPWAVVTLLSVPPAKTGEFLDIHLYKQALAGGKEVVGLETIDEQLAVFEGLSEEDQVALLEQTLDVRDRLPSVFEQLLETYLRRDIGGLLRLSDRYLRGGGDTLLAERFRSAALDVRNARMAERMVPLIEAGGCFIAVGALHLPGDGGVLARLQDAGFSLRAAY